MESLPKQRISYNKKIENDYQWAKDTIDSLLDNDQGFLEYNSTSYKEMLANYRLYNNILDQEDLKKECNPFGIEVAEYKDEIKPYNKIHNKVNTLLGEELKKDIQFQVVLTDSSSIKEKELVRTQLSREYLESQIEKHKNRILNQFKKNNPMPNTSEENAEQIQQEYQQQMLSEVDRVLNPKEIEIEMSKSYLDRREILVGKILKYLIKYLDIREKKNDAYKHGLISDIEAVWVGTINDMPEIRIVNPLNLIYHKSPEVKYIQDGDYAGMRIQMTYGEVLDQFGQLMTQDQLDQLDIENYHFGSRGIVKHNFKKDIPLIKQGDIYTYNTLVREGSYGTSEQDLIEVIHLEWVSRAKVGFLTYTNEEGEEVVDLVSETFKVPLDSVKTTVKKDGIRKTIYEFPTGEKLQWEWIPEVWEATRIGGNIYVKIRKKPNQHRSLDNPWKVKLGYHGLVYSNMNAKSISLLGRAKPFQYLYFLIVHKLKRLIARDKGKAFIFDTSSIDEQLGLETTIHYLEEMDIQFINPLANADSEGFANRGNVTSVLDRSNIQHIQNYINLMQAIDLEIGDAMGISKQREGQIGAYEAVKNTQQSINQSSYITEIYVYKHESLWEKILTSLVECTQLAWKDSKITKQFVLDDMSRYTLDFSGDEIVNSDFGVFVSNSSKDVQLLDTLKNMALPILQNEGKLSDIIKIYNSVSLSELSRTFEQEEKERELNIQRQQEAMQKIEQDKIQFEKEENQIQRDHEIFLKDKELEIELLKIEADLAKYSPEDNSLEKEKLQIEREKIKTEAKLKEKEIKVKEKAIKTNKQKDK